MHPEVGVRERKGKEKKVKQNQRQVKQILTCTGHCSSVGKMDTFSVKF